MAYAENFRGGPKHRRSQGRAKGAMPPPKFVENIVILCFERRFSKQNSVIRLKLSILVYTAEHWQYKRPKTVYTFFIFRVWGEGHGTVATPLHTLVPLILLLLMKHKHWYVPLVKTTCIDGANTVAMMFSTTSLSCDEFQIDRFIKCMRKWEVAKDQGSFSLFSL